MLNASDDDDLVEFAATARVFMGRNVATKAGSFHDANDPMITAPAGCVIASPSYPAHDPGLTDQNYVFHWIRDGAITAMELAAAPSPDGSNAWAGPRPRRFVQARSSRVAGSEIQ
jgi:glucoamylase